MPGAKKKPNQGRKPRKGYKYSQIEDAGLTPADGEQTIAETLAVTLFQDGLKYRSPEWWDVYASKIMPPNRWLQ